MKDEFQYQRVFICLGSNIGDKVQHCKNGIDALIGSGNAILKNQSPFYYSEPTDFKDQDWFINGVIEIETRLEPIELIKTLKSIERQEGRTESTVQFGPRVLDMDIIFFDDWIIRLPGLVIPHPRMHLRRFVLQPLCDINPNVVHPVFKQTVKSMLEQITPDQQRIKLVV